ncbi:type II secretion system protein GspI [Acinetobacter wanghuae]|uniref:Type II secretion system protein I n=1 Tax=Acinetobacter wanghuae TaxID=2662362 RepID=A0A5Q0P3V1_9GAMM|nr:type II secretion system minor pseudopilin GspI [Acinetobacter wanghuae]MQW91165.1 type II secretion system protein GspI [Acinetobacter wanghuae]QGA11282.1 type II secretion system protein GspI [Acinetobacter wanghuae]
MQVRYFFESIYSDISKLLKSNANRIQRLYAQPISLSYEVRKQHLILRSSGFTLLEVMVALAIFATAAMTLTKVAMQYTQATSHAILRTKAQFVALNEAAHMDIHQEWLSGTASRKVTQQGEMWQIDKKAEATISPNVQRVDIQVSLVNSDTEQVEAGISSLTFFNHKVEEK